MDLAAQLDDAGTRSADAVARLWRAGELSAKKDGIGVYKVPLCLAVSGQHGLANNALDEIVAGRTGRRRAKKKFRSLQAAQNPKSETLLKYAVHEILFMRVPQNSSIALQRSSES